MSKEEMPFRIPSALKETPKILMTAEEIAEAVKKRAEEAGLNISTVFHSFMALDVKREGIDEKEKQENFKRLYKEAAESLGIKPPDSLFEQPENKHPFVPPEKPKENIVTKQMVDEAEHRAHISKYYPTDNDDNNSNEK